MRSFVCKLWGDEAGQDSTEYALLVVLIALAITAGMMMLASGVNNAFVQTSNTLQGQAGS